MFSKFAIIPSKQYYEDYADDIIAMMRHNIKHIIHFDYDKEYDKLLSSRILKWTKKEYNIITVDDNYGETSCIIVRFSDKDYKPEKMSLIEFIDLVTSFEAEKKETNNNNQIDNENNCAIM